MCIFKSQVLSLTFSFSDSIGNGNILLKPTLYSHLQHAKKCLLENTGRHLGLASCTIGKDDRHLGKLEAEFPGQKLHFNLEGIAYKPYLVKLNSF